MQPCSYSVPATSGSVQRALRNSRDADFPALAPVSPAASAVVSPRHSFASPGLPLTAISGPTVREDQVWYGLNTGLQLLELFLPLNDFTHYEWAKRPLALLIYIF